MRYVVLLSAGVLGAVLTSCDRPAAGPTIGDEPKRVIEASEASRAQVEKKLEEQRQALKTALGEGAPGAK